jgi:acetolactate synthase-1/3 small subunit
MNDNGRNPTSVTKHTFVVYVEDKPGVLNRVASLFRRRAFNIETLSVGHSEEPGVSRMTIVMEVDDVVAERVQANLNKLLNVLYVEDVSHMPSVMRDLALIKVQADSNVRAEVLQLCDVFRARAVDVNHEALIVEITGTEEKIEGLLDVLRPFGIIEFARTGRVAMRRGSESRVLAVHSPSETVMDRASA